MEAVLISKLQVPAGGQCTARGWFDLFVNGSQHFTVGGRAAGNWKLPLLKRKAMKERSHIDLAFLHCTVWLPITCNGVPSSQETVNTHHCERSPEVVKAPP